MASANVDPVEPRATLSGDHVSSGGYPISIAVACVAPSRTPQLGGQPAAGNGGDGTREGNGQNRAPCQGRARRRTDAQPQGRADGMAMDAPLWRAGNRATRSDGVALANSWPASAGVVAPPLVPQKRCGMAPWPGQPGPMGARCIARKGRGRGKQKRTAPADQTKAAQVAEAPGNVTKETARDPLLTKGVREASAGSGSGSGPAGHPPLVANRTERCTAEADRASPMPDSSHPMTVGSWLY
ncbi:hypothetical protein ZWY2020_047348 [Hordeum vulgare]|nr:hypothetical protein ZWY2020_047348 [Hordeum vulgare]